MSNRTRMALGLAGGYLLGRRHKAGWLLAAVGLVASRGLGAAVSRRGAEALESSPELRELAEQSRRTAVALAGGRIQQLTERIHAATEALRPSPSAEQPEEKPGEQPEGEQQAEGKQQAEVEQQPKGEQQPEGEQAKAEEEPEGEQAKAEEPEEPKEQPEGGEQPAEEPQTGDEPAAKDEPEAKDEPAGAEAEGRPRAERGPASGGDSGPRTDRAGGRAEQTRGGDEAPERAGGGERTKVAGRPRGRR